VSGAARHNEAMAVTPATQVCVELLGVARLAAAARALAVPWSHGMILADQPAALAAACPALHGSVVTPDGRLQAGFVFSLEGRTLAPPWDTPLLPGARLLLLSADAGG
jgi:hypothetical protein